MHYQSTILGAALVAGGLALPLTPTHPEGPKHIIITSKNTLNATAPPPKIPQPAPQSTEQLPLYFTNNLNGGAVNGYVTGLDPNGALVFVQSNSQFYYPSCDASTGVPQAISGNIAIPLGGQGSTVSVTLPNYVSSGRIWFSEGTLDFYTVCGSGGNPNLVEPSSTNPSDPNSDTNWGFAEFTNNDGGLYADISYVDFLGLPLGIEMVAGDGSTQSALGVPANAVSTLCSQLAQQGSSDGQPWGDLCQAGSNGQAIRAIAPQDYISTNNNAFSSYWTNYVNQVWSYYESNTLTINSQAGEGAVTCTVSGDTMNCAGDNQGYQKPDASDIFGCNSGPFALDGQNSVHYAVVPRLCAAFDRSTFFVSGGSSQPGPAESSYYGSEPTNYYSKFIHELEVDGKGYAFPYDDVTASGAVNQAGVVTDSSPQKLTVIVGGPLS